MDHWRAVRQAVEDVDDWERLLAAERHLQRLLPEAVLVGGTAAALHAHHRTSMDGDHVLTDLRERFAEVLADLEAAAGWQTAPVQRPVLILGSLDGIPTGIRQLRRVRPLDTESIQGLLMPTLAETARVKAWLLATRNTVRDYLDLVVLLDCLGDDACAALATMDQCYPQDNGQSVLAEVVDRLQRGAPQDLAGIDLKTYRGLRPPYDQWQHLLERGQDWSRRLAALLLGAVQGDHAP